VALNHYWVRKDFVIDTLATTSPTAMRSIDNLSAINPDDVLIRSQVWPWVSVNVAAGTTGTPSYAWVDQSLVHYATWLSGSSAPTLPDVIDGSKDFVAIAHLEPTQANNPNTGAFQGQYRVRFAPNPGKVESFGQRRALTVGGGGLNVFFLLEFIDPQGVFTDTASFAHITVNYGYLAACLFGTNHPL
jgi:hypothetical protein